MPWHLSRSDPRKVYDERHRTVCICQTAEQAALIVEAVTSMPRDAASTFVRLREEKDHPKKFEMASITVSFEEDECCGPRIATALRRGDIGDFWACPKCGTEWKPGRAGILTHWAPQVLIEVLR